MVTQTASKPRAHRKTIGQRVDNLSGWVARNRLLTFLLIYCPIATIQLIFAK